MIRGKFAGAIAQIVFVVVFLLLATGTAMGIMDTGDEKNCRAVEDARSADDKQPSRIQLFGVAEINDTPKVELFERKVLLDNELPCSMKTNLYRLTRVASDPRMRQIVWKRMKKQELLWVSGKTLSRIQEIAASCNMPLTREVARKDKYEEKSSELSAGEAPVLR